MPTAKNLALDFIKLGMVNAFVVKVQSGKLKRNNYAIYFEKYISLFE